MTNQEMMPLIVRTERGLTIQGTRITIYDILDYLKVDWPPKLIQDRLGLTNEQMTVALNYITSHQVEVTTEYETLQKQAQEIRQYWEDRNRERLAAIALLPPTPDQAELYAKLLDWKQRINSSVA